MCSKSNIIECEDLDACTKLFSVNTQSIVGKIAKHGIGLESKIRAVERNGHTKSRVRNCAASH